MPIVAHISFLSRFLTLTSIAKRHRTYDAAMSYLSDNLAGYVTKNFFIAQSPRFGIFEFLRAIAICRCTMLTIEKK